MPSPIATGSRMKELLLVGGGHAHLFVLRRLAQERRAEVAATLVSPSRWQYYSGMLPGWIAGSYREEECRLDLQALAQAAGVTFIEQAAVGLDATRQFVVTASRQQIPFDALSLDIGSETRCADLTLLGNRLLPIRARTFHERWRRILAQANSNPSFRLAVVGGGAAGVEVALAARTALSQISQQIPVDLVSGRGGPLPSLGTRARHLAACELQRVGVTVHRQRGFGTEHGLRLEDGTALAADAVIATTGANAPPWLRDCGAAHDDAGHIRVDDCYRSFSHPAIFAAGDICAREAGKIQRSGVYAVRAGPILAENLLAALSGRALTAHHPRRRALYILAAGQGRAIASWGPLAGSGRWAWRLKDRIDRRFMSHFAQP